MRSKRVLRTKTQRRYKLFCGAALWAMIINATAPLAAAASNPGRGNDGNTTTPIKHVIVIIGEKRQASLHSSQLPSPEKNFAIGCHVA